MKLPRIHSHRFGLQIIESVPALKQLWDELMDVIASISDQDLIDAFKSAPTVELDDLDGHTIDFHKQPRKKMSLSDAINGLLDRRLTALGWTRQSALFQGEEYSKGTRWKLDFSKTIHSSDAIENDLEDLSITGMAVEVAFNHGEAIAWNLLKPVMAAELNHVEKETNIGAGIGIVITATSDLKKAGAFDGAVGEYEKFLRYLKPMRNQLTVPMVIIGLEPPSTFRINKKNKSQDPNSQKNIGEIEMLSSDQIYVVE